MTTTPDPIFIDTNVLIYANLALSPFHQEAVATIKMLAASGVQLWISRQVLREYLAGMTRPSALTGAIAVNDLVADIHTFSSQFFVAEDGPDVTQRLVNLFSNVPMAGKQVHDANIVATMLAQGVLRLLTHNIDDFKRFSHLITLVPLVANPPYTPTLESPT